MSIKPVRQTEWIRPRTMIPSEYGDVVYDKWMEFEILRREKGSNHKYEVRYNGKMAALFIIS